MTKIWTFLAILTVSTLFIHVPDRGEIHFLLNDKVILSYNQFVWMSTTYLFPIAFIAIILDETQEKKNLVRVFLLLTIADFVGFLLSYDDPLKDYVITFNILKLVIFISAIALDEWNQSTRALKGLN
jgi:hypothetical protein